MLSLKTMFKIIFTSVVILLLLMIHSLESNHIVSSELSEVLVEVSNNSFFISLTLIVALAITYRKFFITILTGAEEDIKDNYFPKLEVEEKHPKTPKEDTLRRKNRLVQKSQVKRKIETRKVSKRDASMYSKKDAIFSDDETIWIDGDK